MIEVLSEIPRDALSWDRWGFHNRDSHQRIIQAIAALPKGPSLTDYQLYPIQPEDFQGWLARHQQSHLEACAILNVVNVDLQDLRPDNLNELTAWVALHDQQHRDLEARLSI